ncbi:hypothetical protein ACXPSQ_004929, partial [Salmonella enterica subsp. enterica serovar Newport]
HSAPSLDRIPESGLSTPARWSDGVTAALLSYNLMTNLWSTFHWYWHLKLHAKDLAGKWHSHS